MKGSPVSTDYNIFLNVDEKYTAGVFTRNLNIFGWLYQRIADDYTFGYTFELNEPLGRNAIHDA